MHVLDLAVAAAAGLALAMSLFAHGLRRRWVNEPLLALALGVLMGPAALGWLDLAAHGDERHILEVAARFTLAVALVSVGVELRSSLASQWRSLAVLVLGGAALMWAAGALLAGGLLGLGLLPALLVGAVLAPIDPILTATVATGRLARESLPARLRHLLTAESSARHGLGLPLVLLPATLLTKAAGEAWVHWLTTTLLWKGVAAAVIGGAVGYAAGRAQRWSAAHRDAESATGPLVALYPALALALAAGVELAGSDGLLAVLAAALAFAWVRGGADDDEALEREERQYEALLKQVLQVPVFFLLGLALPWGEWAALGWRAPALVAAMLLLRRLPAVLLLKPLVGRLRGWDEALFTGWFGPAGVGALYFAAVAHKETGRAEVWAAATLVIAATVVAHDLTATPLSRWLARRPAGGGRRGMLGE